jgi:AraC family transcriptional regulator
LGKIAVEFESIPTPFARDAVPELLVRRQLARGDGWSVSDVICSAGPQNRPVEEQHSSVCIAIVRAGSFQYRSSAGRELMTPGSIMLGNNGQDFECGHEHGVGDRCISFAYEPRYLESLAAEAGVRTRGAHFSTLRVPPVRELSGLVARAFASLTKSAASTPNHEQATFWGEVGVELAVRALEFGSDGEPNRGSSPSAEARVTRTVRAIESGSDGEHDLGALAQEAKLSRYHFLRLFQRLTGLTPHQYVLRARLRRAAMRLLLERARVLDIALDSGFGDVSNFNHAFRAEFGVSPRSYRTAAHHSPTAA